MYRRFGGICLHQFTLKRRHISMRLRHHIPEDSYLPFCDWRTSGIFKYRKSRISNNGIDSSPEIFS